MITTPAEWSPHRATWAAWPSHVDQWFEHYLPARDEIIPMIKMLAKGERIKLLATGDEAVNDARLYFEQDHVDVIHAAFSHLWMRDLGPFFIKDKHGPLVLCPQFNGWGKREVAKYDDEVSGFIARASGLRLKHIDLCVEGGALDFDGDGRVLASRRCLLDRARNPEMTQAKAEELLSRHFGVTQIIWLDGAILNDPADGHVNTMARFVAPHKVVCQVASSSDDPNAALYEQIATTLADAGLEVVRLPSPGRIFGLTSDIAPASHMNFVVGNQSVIMPSYENTYASEAVAILRTLFEGRDVVAMRSDHLLAGGRSFHALTRSEPAF